MRYHGRVFPTITQDVPILIIINLIFYKKNLEFLQSYSKLSASILSTKKPSVKQLKEVSSYLKWDTCLSVSPVLQLQAKYLTDSLCYRNGIWSHRLLLRFMGKRLSTPPVKLRHWYCRSWSDLCWCGGQCISSAAWRTPGLVAEIQFATQQVQQSAPPWALVITPYRSLAEGEEPVHLVTVTVIARCRRCRTYINPYVQFIDGGNRYVFDTFTSRLPLIIL